jgi:uncharacterized short protein YbdD (DUF466 family)
MKKHSKSLPNIDLATFLKGNASVGVSELATYFDDLKDLIEKHPDAEKLTLEEFFAAHPEIFNDVNNELLNAD